MKRLEPTIFESCVPVVHVNKIILLIGEDDPDNLLDGDAVIGKKNCSAHGTSSGR